MDLLAAFLSTLLAVLLAFNNHLSTGESKPSILKNRHPVGKEHIVQKRATVQDVLGDLTAGAPGILNEDRLPLGNCKEIFDSDLKTSGLYRIYPGGSAAEFTVFCDMTLRGGGWTVILRRINDSLSFNRNSTDYRNGFGRFNANFWLGLEKIKDITAHKSQTYQLYIGLQSFSSSDPVAFSLYESFSLGNEASKYMLNIGNLSTTVTNTAGNSLNNHNGRQFSTADDDNDANNNANCALDLCAGWWYTSCLDSHLTGKHFANGVLPNLDVPDGIIWESWRGEQESLQSAIMAVRPV